ncbi:MAG: hypothetical protein QJR09_12015 [Micrococcus sp.]|nr:hypothetical protein [Micrococcus sp.]
MSDFVKVYPRARVRYTPADIAGKTWAHARWWITWETAPGRVVAYDRREEDPAVERHALLTRAHAEATRSVARIRRITHGMPGYGGAL